MIGAIAGDVIGENCNVGDHCFIEAGAVVGNHVTIKNGNMIWEGVTLEDGVFVGPGVCLTNDRYPRSARLPQACERYQDRNWLVPTRVKTGASLGAAAVILGGVTIGEYALQYTRVIHHKDKTLIVGVNLAQSSADGFIRLDHKRADVSFNNHGKNKIP